MWSDYCDMLEPPFLIKAKFGRDQKGFFLELSWMHPSTVIP